MGLIKVGSHIDLDFDHQFVPVHKFDAKYSYKQDFGYFPGWASIGGIIVGDENRDGNTNVVAEIESFFVFIFATVLLKLIYKNTCFYILFIY